MRETTIYYWRWCVVAAGALLAGCTGSNDRVEHFLVSPGRYTLYDCAQLAQTEKGLMDREKELARLGARAREGPAGGMIATLTYEPEYRTTRGSLIDLHNEQKVKNCQPSHSPGRAAR